MVNLGYLLIGGLIVWIYHLSVISKYEKASRITLYNDITGYLHTQVVALHHSWESLSYSQKEDDIDDIIAQCDTYIRRYERENLAFEKQDSRLKDTPERSLHRENLIYFMELVKTELSTLLRHHDIEKFLDDFMANLNLFDPASTTLSVKKTVGFRRFFSYMH